MRHVLLALTMAFGAAGLACSGAEADFGADFGAGSETGVESGEAELGATEHVKVDAAKLGTESTEARAASCSTYWACIRACVRRDPRGTSNCEDHCDARWPECEP